MNKENSGKTLRKLRGYCCRARTEKELTCGEVSKTRRARFIDCEFQQLIKIYLPPDIFIQ